VPEGYYLCKECHQRQLRDLGLIADVDEEESEEREEERKIKEEQKWHKWISEKEKGGYLTISEAGSLLNRSRRWVWNAIKEFNITGLERVRQQAPCLLRKNGICLGPETKELLYIGESELVLSPEKKLIWNSWQRTLILKDLVELLRSITEKEDVEVRDEGIFVSSSAASQIIGCTSRWVNQLVKRGRLPGHYFEHSESFWARLYSGRLLPALYEEKLRLLEAPRSNFTHEEEAELEKVRVRVAHMKHIHQGEIFSVIEGDFGKVVLFPEVRHSDKLVKSGRLPEHHGSKRVWVELETLDEFQEERRSQPDAQRKHPGRQR